MKPLHEINEQIKVLKHARDILRDIYEQSEFHKKRVDHPHEAVPSLPEDEEIYKLLNAIHELEKQVKQLQDVQFELLKKEE